MLSLAEDGIRAHLDGERDGTTRRTGDITVEGSTVKRMRGGIALALASGAGIVRNCIVTESGYPGHAYGLPSNALVRVCKGDAAYTPLLRLGYSNKRNADIELELLDAPHYTSNDLVALINGSGHKVTITKPAGKPLAADLKIVCGQTHRADAEDVGKTFAKGIGLKQIFSILATLTVLQAAALEPPQWDVAMLSKPPSAVEAQEGKVEGLQSLFLDGLHYKGRPTKFYAYLGFPTNATGKVPAVVLVHGGGGTATAPWAKYWIMKGYAALALDTEGHLPVKACDRKPGDPGWRTMDSLGQPWGGQPQRPKGFADPALPPEEQWLYHAVADSILSISFLTSRPEVDANRIGIVGISMGSVVCSIVGGLDQRLAFVVPQYIGGNNDLGNVWYAIIKEHPDVMRWDPANFYRQPKGKAHWLWINGDNDKYGLPPMTTKSWRETGPNSWMTLLPTQGHGGAFGETGPNALREIYAFADSVTRGIPPLARILSTARVNNSVTLIWREATPVTRSQIIHTTEAIPTVAISGDIRKDWPTVNWHMQDMPLPKVIRLPDGALRADFPLPAGVKAAYINLIDERGLAVSSDFLFVQP